MYKKNCFRVLSEIFLILMLITSSVGFGYANSTDQVRYWIESTMMNYSLPPTVSGAEQLELTFYPDKGVCTYNYGQEWDEVCSRSVGDILPSAKDIRLEPPHPGSWKWTSSNSLQFYPSKTWPAKQNYTVYIGKKSLPKHTQITKDIRFDTEELKAEVSGSFKFDPDQYKNMLLTGSIHFNYPVSLHSARKHFSLEKIGNGENPKKNGNNADSLLLGEAELSMDASNQVLYYSMPILQLPTEVVNVRVDIASGYRPEFGGKSGAEAHNTIKIPSKGSMLQIDDIRMQIVDMPDLSAKQTLNIELSMPVLPKNLEKKMQVYLMPRQQIDSESLEDEPPFKWWNLAAVNSELLGKAQALKLTILNDPDTPTRFISFAVETPIEDSRYLYLNIDKDLQGPEDYLLGASKQVFMEMVSLYSDVKIMQTGSVLNLNGDQKVSLYARNLDEIKYTIYQIRPEYLNMYVSTFGLRGRHGGNISLSELSIVSELNTKLLLKDSEKAQFTSLDLAPFLAENQDSIFFISIDGYLNHSKVASDSRFIMLTDIGLIRKKNDDGSSHVYAVSLETGKPLSRVRIEVLGKNGIAIYTGFTKRSGMVDIPSLETYGYEKEPVVIVAKNRKDLAYIPYSQHDDIIDVSQSYTGGKKGIRDGIYGFIFNQRDIYKPGETAHFGFILKQADFDASTLSGIPLNISIYDSNRKKVDSKKIKLNSNGFGDMTYSIPPQAITGTYSISISMADDGTSLLSGSFQVEEFEPDTLRLEAKFDLPPKKGWYLPSELKNLKVNASLMNLFGAPAVDHLITGEVKTQQGSFNFSEYDDWNFYDAARLDRSKDYSFIGINSDEKGLASFHIPSPLFEKESSVLQVKIRGFNAAGSRSVMTNARLVTSPLEAVMGWKSTANLNYIPQDTKAHLDIMAIDSSLNPHAFGAFSMEYYDVDYVRSLVKNPRGEYVYRTERKDTLVESKKLKLTEKSLKWDINTQKSGDKLLLAKDTTGRIILRIPYTVAGESLSQFGELNTADLRVQLNKAQYNANEEIEIYMHLPYDGAGLITIERENVLSQEWFTAKRGERIHKIKVPKSIEGRAYLNVLYFRDSKDADIFTEPSANVVIPFTANIKKRELDLSLDVLDTGVQGDGDMPVVRPGTNLKVKLISKTPSKAIVYAVDEGILQMTGYKTPNPIYELLVDRALEVSTYQYFDLLMPEYGVLTQYLSKFGGDAMMKMMSAQNANPFRRKGIKSVAFWSGIIDVDSNGSVIDIPIPATFNGQLRLITVGVSESKMNAVEKKVLARSEVVIQPSVPYFVAPGDEFVANLTLIDMAEMGEKNRTWQLSVEAGKALELLDKENIAVELEPQKQKTMALRFKVLTPDNMSDEDVAQLLGNQEIRFHLSNGKSTIIMPISLAVRPAVGLQNDIHFGQLTKKDSNYGKYIEFSNDWYPQLSEFSASMSPVPKSIVQGLVEELRGRRYTCTPMRLSEDFPLLSLMKNPQFALKSDIYSKGESSQDESSNNEYSQDAMAEDVARAIQNLASHYSNDLHFTLWPSGYGRSSLIDNIYFADFLVEAKNMGISLPYGLENNFLKALEEEISRMPHNMDEARSLAYGAWVLTQNGVITSNVMANLVSWLEIEGGDWKKDIIAPLMAASMNLMMEEEMANRLLAEYNPDPNALWSWYADFDGLAERALYLSIVAQQFPEHMNTKKTTAILNQIIELISTGYYSDMSAALAARALVFYSVAQEGRSEQAPLTWDMKVFDDDKEIILSGASENIQTSTPSSTEPSHKTNVDAPAKNPPKTPIDAAIQSENGILVSNMQSIKMESNAPLYYHVNTLGYPEDLPKESSNSGLELFREYRDLDGNVLSELTVGEDVIVAIRASIRSESYHDVVITDLLPASFELILAEDGKITQTGTEEGRAMSSLSSSSSPVTSQTEDDMQISYIDRREDRMIIYAKLDNNETVFRYRVRVAHKGDFVIPPIIGKGLKDPTIKALTLMEFGTNNTISVK